MKNLLAFLIIPLSCFLICNQTNIIILTSLSEKKLPSNIIDATYEMKTYKNDIEIFYGYSASPRFKEDFPCFLSLNSFYQSQFQKRYHQMKNISDYASLENPLSSTVYAYDHTFEVKYLSDDFISILEDTFTYAGGAHPDTFNEAHTFSLKDGKELKLADFFTSQKSDTEELIKSYIIQQLQKTPDDYFPDAAKTVSEMSLDSFNFYLSKNGIVIFFNRYEIAPYVRGLVEFTIPY